MNNARILADRLAGLLRREQAAMAEFLIALAQFDRHRCWVELGHSSLFYFLYRELGLSKGAAHYRKTAAELIQTYPEIVEPLRDGRLCITSIVPLAKVLTPENREVMLPRFFQRSRREAMGIAAALQPAKAAPHRDVVTSVAPATQAVAMSVRDPAATDSRDADVAAAVQPVEPDPAVQLVEPDRAVQPVEPESAPRLDVTAPAAPARESVDLKDVPPPAALKAPLPDSADPVTSELSRLHVTVSRRFLDKLEAARAALSHARPGATAEGILEAGLDLILAQHARRKGLVKRPRQQPKPAAPGTVPASVKREVWIRDNGRCQWPLEAGGICASRYRVELDHVVPEALGGPSTVENMRLLCKFHNDVAARRVFGDEWMNQFTGPGRGGPRPPQPRTPPS